MKEKDARIDLPQKIVMYVEKEDGSYGAMETGSYMVKNYIDDFMGKQAYRWQKSCDQLTSNEITVVGYYQKILGLSLADLIMRTGISRGRVKKHLNPTKFDCITVKELKKYSEVFGVPLNNFFQITKQKGEMARFNCTACDNPHIFLMEGDSKNG